jgi:hypothetical protein
MAPLKHFPSIGNYSLYSDQNAKKSIVSCMVVKFERIFQETRSKPNSTALLSSAKNEICEISTYHTL